MRTPIDGKLTDAEVHAVYRPGKYYDGIHGLYLRVMPSGSRQWVQRITVQGKMREFGLGGYPVVTLAEARQHALRNRRIARAGGDPMATPWQAQNGLTGLSCPQPAPAVAVSTAPVFAEAMEIVIGLHTPRWRNGSKSAAQWRASLNHYAVPVIGQMPVDRIDRSHVCSVLEPIWTTRHETARRVKQRLRTIMDWAVASGHRGDNPVDRIQILLPHHDLNVTHHRALPYGQVAGAVQAVLSSGALPATRLALVFLVLTACRSGEVRHAAVSEVDWTNDIWTIPGSRTKSGRRHRIPLSDGARHVMDCAPLDTASGLLFPNQFGRALSDHPMSSLLRRLGIDAVPHGFRSSFRDWTSDEAKAPREVAEMALAHVVYNNAEAAYARSDLLDQRRVLMQDWCDYLGLNQPQLADR